MTEEERDQIKVLHDRLPSAESIATFVDKEQQLKFYVANFKLSDTLEQERYFDLRTLVERAALLWEKNPDDTWKLIAGDEAFWEAL